LERLILGFLLTFIISKSAFSFTLNNTVNASFAQDEVKVNIASHSCSNLGITNEELLSLAEEAGARYWNKVPTSRVRLVRGEIINVATDFQTGLVCSSLTNGSCNINSALVVSNDITISCNTNLANFSNSNLVLGVTVPNNVSGRTINGALFLINDDPANSFAGKSPSEKIAIVAHELGHALGLGHSNFDKNLMYFQSLESRTALGPDDVDGITYLYPVEQPTGGCGTIGNITPPTSKGPFLLTFVLALAISLLVGWLHNEKRIVPFLSKFPRS
jgi:hypothetical protein